MIPSLFYVKSCRFDTTKILWTQGDGFEPTYDAGYEPTELPILYPVIYGL